MLDSMRIAALRPYGDPRFSDHWDIMDLDGNAVEILPQNRSNATVPKSFRSQKATISMQ